jgi:hypothetical protein
MTVMCGAIGFGGRIEALDFIELYDPAVSTGSARMQMRLYFPTFSSFGQFDLYILTLEKQDLGSSFHQRFREANKLV